MTKRVFWFVLAVVALMVAAVLAGCSRRTVYVPVESVRVAHDSVRVASSLLDRVVTSDTVRERVSGDSIYIEVTRWRWRDREVRDTVYASRVDSVSVPVPYMVEVPVERELTWWQRFRLGSWWLLVAAVVAVAVYAGKRRIK